MKLKKNEPTEAAKKEAKLHAGISLVTSGIRMKAVINGDELVHTYTNIPVTKENVKYVALQRFNALAEIEKDVTKIAKWFPRSKSAKKYSDEKEILTMRPFMQKWLTITSNKVQDISAYARAANEHILPIFGDLPLDSIDCSMIEEWRSAHLEPKYSNKSINDMFIPLRGVFKLVKKDRLIDYNPMEDIENLARKFKSKADPFSTAEIQVLWDTDTNHYNEKMAALFSIYTGLGPSEWAALAWEDIDLINGKVFVSRSISKLRTFYATKEESRVRTVELLEPAIEILKTMKTLTRMLEPHDIEVLQHDNRTVEKERVTIVFPQTGTNKIWKNLQYINSKVFKPMLNKCGMRYRPVGQCRHTFACHMLTLGVAERWIAKQMGHNSIAMLEKHYGKWMTNEIPDMAQRISKMLSEGTDEVIKSSRFNLL